MANQIKTADLENQLSDIKSFNDYIESNTDEFISDTKLSDYLKQLIEETGCKKPI